MLDRPAEAFQPGERSLLNDRFCHPAIAHVSTSGESSLYASSRMLMPLAVTGFGWSYTLSGQQSRASDAGYRPKPRGVRLLAHPLQRVLGGLSTQKAPHEFSRLRP